MQCQPPLASIKGRLDRAESPVGPSGVSATRRAQRGLNHCVDRAESSVGPSRGAEATHTRPGETLANLTSLIAGLLPKHMFFQGNNRLFEASCAETKLEQKSVLPEVCFFSGGPK